MAKNISILGSTGSVGTQTLEVARNLGLNVLGMTANKNIDLLEKQVREFKPLAVAVMNEYLAEELGKRLQDMDVQVHGGVDGINAVATLQEVDTVVTSLVGISGLIPTLKAIRKGKNIALANKETLVTAGQIIMAEAEKHGVEILPVDSEHSAIFQCLMGNGREEVSSIILTASGGPFRGKKAEQLKNVTLDEALRHPNWKMGSKITIDSATLMNKGLEVIEAKWMFGLRPDQIKVIIHPQSIVHSMVEYIDGSIIAQLGSVDMKFPIHFALTFPSRVRNNFPKLDLLTFNKLTFEEPDYGAFPSLRLAFEALEAGGTMPAVMSAANEVAVGLLLNRKIDFIDIPRMIEAVMSKHIPNINPSLNDIIEVDMWAREMTNKFLINK